MSADPPTPPSQFELTDARGSVRTFTLATDKVVIGSGPGCDLQVRAADMQPQHLRLVATSFGHRVEPVQPGGTIEVNGEELFCKDLEPGDQITVGSTQLLWLGPQAVSGTSAVDAPPPAAPVVDLAPRSVARRARTRPARRGGANWLPISAVFCVVVGAIVLVLRGCAGSTWPHSPQHYVDLARAQVGNMQPQRALDTLDFALRDATGATREEALQLRADIVRVQTERSMQAQIDAARRACELLQGFEGRYLKTAPERPAARELVRLVDAWSAAHGEICRQHSQGPPLLATAAELRQRFVSLAALHEPDTAADVTFAARSRLRFQWREYRSALEVLDGFLAANDDAAVRSERQAILDEGEQWLAGKLRGIDLLLARGDTRNAALDLEQLERWSILPQWRPQFEERQRRVSGND